MTPASLSLRRADLARATLRAFATLGFIPPTARDLRDTLKISLGALYEIFPSKEELAFEVVRVSLEDARADIAEALRGATRQNEYAACLLSAVAHDETRWLARVLWITDFIRAAWNHRDARLDRVRQMLDEHHRAIAELLDVDLLLATEILALVDGVVLARALTRGRPGIRLLEAWIDEAICKGPSSYDDGATNAYDAPGLAWWEFYARRHAPRPGGSRHPCHRKRRIDGDDTDSDPDES